MNRRASCVGTFEVFEAAHVALRTLLAFSQPVNCTFWPIGMLNWLVAASKLHKHRETCVVFTAEVARAEVYKAGGRRVGVVQWFERAIARSKNIKYKITDCTIL